MRKLKRKKIVKEFLEDRIAKNQRRIERIAEENFKYRLHLNALLQLEVKNTVKPEEKLAEAQVVGAAEHEAVADSADQEIGMSGGSL